MNRIWLNRCQIPALATAGLLFATAGVLAADGAEPLELDCVIEPNVVVDVSSPSEGVLSVLHVDRSQVVQQGQVVAELDSGVEAATVAVTQARASTDTEIRLNQASLGLDQRNLERIETLYTKDAVPLTHRDEVQTTAAVSGLKLKKAREDKHLAELELVRAREVLDRRTVRSPVAGIVVQRYKSPGEYVENEPIIQVAQLHPLRIEVVAPVVMYGLIQPGMQAEVTPELGVDGKRIATVTVVDRVMDAASGTFGVRLELPNADYQLPGGLRCLVRFLPDQPVGDDREGLAATTVTQENFGESATAVPSTSRYELANTRVPVCRSIGPIASIAQSDALTSALRAPNVAVARRDETQASIVGYLVIAPIPVGLTEKQFEKKLIAHGLTDYHAFHSGQNAGSFSLGYYVGKRSAEARLEKLTKLKVLAHIKPRTKSTPEFWLNLTLTDESLDELKLLRKVRETLPQATPKLGLCNELLTADLGAEQPAITQQ